MDNDKLRLAQLRSKIDRAAQLYYTPGCESEITDDQFEALMGQLRQIEPEDYRLTRVGAPYSSSELREKKEHLIPMGSLTNTDNSIAGFADWYDKTLALLGAESADVNVSLKMDGNSVALNYVEGDLIAAISRGNGEVGEQLTANAVKWMGVPTTLPIPFTGTVRGEAILYKAEFEAMKEADPTLTNPRNVGSGILGRTDGTQNELIRLVAFNIVDPKNKFISLNLKFRALKMLGFNPVRYVVASGTREEVIASVEAFFEQMAVERDSLPFEIDGIVVTIDDVTLQQQITKDRKDELRPKFGRAVKFITAKAQTRVTGVNITVGHTGAIFPTITVEPVYVGGVTVSNVAMNNWNEHSEFPSAADVAVGDLVEIARQGDVIPKVVAVIEKPADRQPILEPTICPACGSPTTRVLRGKEGAVTYCVNANNCTGASGYKLKHYIGSSDKGVGIMGFGDSILEAVIDANLVSTPADLYRLTVDQIRHLTIGKTKGGAPIRLGQKRAAGIITEIEKAKKIPLCKFLGALGLELLGRRRAEIIAKEQGLVTLEDWLDEEKLTLIPGGTIGPAIRDGLKRAWPIIEDLLEFVEVLPYTGAVNSGMTVLDEVVVDAIPGQKTIKGSTFCWTGTRELLEETVAAGGIEKSGISAKLDYLVQKDPTSSSNKTLKAESLGVTIIGIECLRAVLAGERELP
jgi:DNA ligase (NAD+)